MCTSAGLFFFYEFFQLNLFDVINPALRQDFNLNATQLSWMSSAYLWADILFLLPAGILLDRYSVRRIILAAMLLCILSTLGFALTHTFWIAFFFHFLSGIGNAFCFLSCIQLVTRWFPPHRHAFVIGSLVTMAFLGGMMAHTPLAWLSDAFGWRTALLIDAAVGGFFFLWIWQMVADYPERLTTESNPIIKVSSHKEAMYSLRSSLNQAFGNPQNWFAGIYTSFLNLPIMVLCALWGASYLQTVHHLPPMSASNIVSLIFLGSIVGCPVIGWLSDHQTKRKPLMIVGAIVTLILELPFILQIPLSQTLLSMLFFSLGFVTSTQVISYPLIAASNPPENTGAATGIASILIMGGAALGQVAFGFLMQYPTTFMVPGYTASDFQRAMWMFPLTALGALIAGLLIRERRC